MIDIVMREDSKDLIKEYIEHKNEIMMNCCGELFRYIGLKEDEEDYYYHCLEEDGNKVYSSCVGWITPLKNKIDDRYYKCLDEQFISNYESIQGKTWNEQKI